MALKVTIDGDELYDYVRIDADDTTETKQVDRMFAASKNEAVKFLNTDFSVTVTNPDGTTTVIEVEAPEEVKEWLFERTAQRYELRGVLPKADFNNIHSYRVYSFR